MRTAETKRVVKQKHAAQQHTQLVACAWDSVARQSDWLPLLHMRRNYSNRFETLGAKPHARTQLSL